MKKNLLKLLLGSSLILSSLATIAATKTATFEVTAIVNASCIVSATDINFGTITPAPTGVANATGSIKSQCTKTTPYSLAINAGNSGDINNRRMNGITTTNNDHLLYNVYTSNTYSTIWGNTIGTNTVALVGNGLEQTSTIYARLNLNQYIQPDNYKDTLTITLTY